MSLPQVELGTVFKGSPSGRIVQAQGQTIALQPNEVVIDIAYSGICGSDLYFLERDVVAGHEGVGVISQVGSAVRNVKVGDRVGYGCNHYSCNYCDECLKGNDQHCPERRLHAMNDSHFGSLGDRAVLDSHFVHIIPPEIKLAHAAPLQCAGATVYGAIVNAGVRAADRVGVIGVGGLGHLAIQFLAKLGASVVVFSGSESKKAQAAELGAREFVATKTNPSLEGVAPLDVLIASTNAQPEWAPYVALMKPRGTIVPLSLSADDLALPYSTVLFKELRVLGSLFSNRYVHREMLRFAAAHGVRPMIEELPMTEENINAAMDRLKRGDVRYRFVLKSQRTDAE